MCNHAIRTVPGPPLYVKAENSQEFIGEVSVRICLNCEHTIGKATNGSLFRPFSFDFEGDTFDQAFAVAREKLIASAL
jgi:hypothetical protein